TDAPAGLRDVRIERGGLSPAISGGAPATWDGKGWTAVLDVNGTPDPDGFWIKAKGADGRPWWLRGIYALWPTASPRTARIEEWAWFSISAAHAYEPGIAIVSTATITDLPPGTRGIRAAFSVEPVSMPLRQSVLMTLVLPAGLEREHVSVYRRDGPGRAWDWMEAAW